jgi:hypothetical protein
MAPEENMGERSAPESDDPTAFLSSVPTGLPEGALPPGVVRGLLESDDFEAAAKFESFDYKVWKALRDFGRDAPPSARARGPIYDSPEADFAYGPDLPLAKRLLPVVARAYFRACQFAQRVAEIERRRAAGRRHAAYLDGVIRAFEGRADLRGAAWGQYATGYGVWCGSPISELRDDLRVSYLDAYVDAAVADEKINALFDEIDLTVARLVGLRDSFKEETPKGGRPREDGLAFLILRLAEMFCVITGVEPLFHTALTKRPAPKFCLPTFLDLALGVCGIPAEQVSLAASLNKQREHDGDMLRTLAREYAGHTPFLNLSSVAWADEIGLRSEPRSYDCC